MRRVLTIALVTELSAASFGFVASCPTNRKSPVITTGLNSGFAAAVADCTGPGCKAPAPEPCVGSNCKA